MGLTGSSSIATLDSVFVSPAQWDAENAVVWLRGEHDLSTIPALSDALCRVVALGDAHLILDLSEVLFMDASTIGMIIHSQQFLRQRSRPLSLRSPSRAARRLLDLCGLTHLIESAPIEAMVMAGGAAALASWVAVPTTDPSESADVSSPKPTSTPDSEPVDLDASRELLSSVGPRNHADRHA